MARRLAIATSWRGRAIAVAVSSAVAAGFIAPTSPASAATTPSSTLLVAQTIGAPALWNAGFTGQGADIAVIDTGVAPIAGLNGTVKGGAGKLYHGPDLSFDSQNSKLRYIDAYGHGTHMAGIAAGKDPNWTPSTAGSYWSGIAPDSKILSMKVAEAGGAVDVTQMIAAIYWVIAHRRDNGLNIRVINLSYGTNGSPEPDSPLAHAVETAWRAGIVVVASSGNTGYSIGSLGKPAHFNYAIAVGAADTKGTLSRTDDHRAAFSNNRDDEEGYTQGMARNVDLYAPGVSIRSLAVSNSHLDLTYPGARDGTRFFRGSGTSQAAAVVSGAAALLISQRPSATPSQIKALLNRACPEQCAYVLNSSKNQHYVFDLSRVVSLATPSATISSTWSSTGAATVSSDRGSAKVKYAGIALSTEKDIFGRSWFSAEMAKRARENTIWSGGSYAGTSNWAGTSWSGNKFATGTWPASYMGTAWSSLAPATNLWDGKKWDGKKWDGKKWDGDTWASNLWASASWE